MFFKRHKTLLSLLILVLFVVITISLNTGSSLLSYFPDIPW
ncbi:MULTISPECIES: hypothetical protein [Clostridium]|nr:MULTISPECIES: hypothetical protein [Clostridium]